MLGSWIIRAPGGSYYLRVRTPASTFAGIAARAARESIWFFARLDLHRGDPQAVAEAVQLDEALGGVSSRLCGAATDRWAIERVVYRLETAVWERRLDFERLPEARDLPTWDDAVPDVPAPTPTTADQHWLELEIVDDETLDPVAGMVVTLKLADGSVTQRTTDAAGRIYVDGQPDDRWEIIDVHAPVEVVGMA